MTPRPAVTRPRTTGSSPPAKRRCDDCGTLYVSRPRREPVCLTCDILARTARGETAAAIGARLGLPAFLVDATVKAAP